MDKTEFQIICLKKKNPENDLLTVGMYWYYDFLVHRHKLKRQKLK